MNRIWQQHFGTSLVATPNDFGFSSARPTVVAPQVLMLLNSDEVVRYALSLADRLAATTPLDFDNAERL